MKHLFLVLAFVVGIASFSTTTFAKDKSDDWHKAQKDLRNDLDFLQKHYDQIKDRVKAFGGDRHQWRAMQDIRADIDLISSQFNSGNFDPRDIHSRIQRSNDDLQRVQDQLDDRNKPPRSGGFYRPN